MARYIDYDKLHDSLYEAVWPKYVDSPNHDELWNLFCAMMNKIELQDKVTDWNDRKKLLQPKRSSFDWSMFHDIINAAMKYATCNATPELEDVFGDWLADYMWSYDINPAELLMEPEDTKEG